MAPLLGTNTLNMGAAALLLPLLLGPPAAEPPLVRLAAAAVKLKPERESREEKRLRSVVELRVGEGG